MATVYNDYSREKQGIFFGLTAPQLVTLVVSGIPTIAAAARYNWPGVGLAALLWAGTAALVLVPVRGRSAFGWLVASVAFAVASLQGWTRWRSKVATGTSDSEQADLPGVLTGTEIHDGPPSGPFNTRDAIIQDHANATWAATAAIVHEGLALSTAEERDQQAQALTELLNGLARGEMVQEVHFMVRSVPDDGAERAEWLAKHMRSDAPALSRRMNLDQAVRLAQMGVRTEAFCMIVVPEARLARAAKEFGRGISGRARAMEAAMTEVQTALMQGLGITQVRWLTSPELAVAVRTGFAPGDRAGIVSALSAAATSAGVNTIVPWEQAGPSGAELVARHYSHDAWNSVACAIKLPPKGAVVGALAPVLAPKQVGERRSLTVVYSLVSARTADRQSGAAQTRASIAEGLREWSKSQPRAKDLDEINRLKALDRKIADGNALVRAYAVACVTVPKTQSISAAGRTLELSIRNAGFPPLRLDLAQDTGFVVANIPLGVGLNRKLELW